MDTHWLYENRRLKIGGKAILISYGGMKHDSLTPRYSEAGSKGGTGKNAEQEGDGSGRNSSGNVEVWETSIKMKWNKFTINYEETRTNLKCCQTKFEYWQFHSDDFRNLNFIDTSVTSVFSSDFTEERRNILFLQSGPSTSGR